MKERKGRLEKFRSKLTLVNVRIDSLKDLKNDPLIKIAFLISCFFLFFNFSFLIISFSFLPGELPLFYSRSWGEEQLGTKTSILILPVGSLFFTLVNSLLAKKIYSSERLLGRILFGTSTFVLFITAVTLYKIITLIS